MNYLPWHHEQFAALSERVERLPHALLFTGTAGIGKRQFANAVAHGLLCERPGNPLHACGACEACHWMASEAHPDCRVIQPELAEASEDDEPVKRKKRDLAAEIMEAYQGQGNAIRKRDEVHKMAQANKAFAHFRW